MTAKVIYSMNVSLDGYINSPTSGLDWADVDEEIHAWFNDGARNAAADIYGRRMYELMASYWPFALDDPDAGDVERDFAQIWKDTPKIVFSRTLEEAPHAHRLLRTDVADEIASLKAEFAGDLGIGGPTIAAALIERNLVDEYQMVVHPVVLGGGTPYFPPGMQLDLRLTQTRRFANGAMLVAYEPRR
ncbi:MAG: dihydrofolate reductase family protein [Chloroflexota bacterium]|nr:dihydrofolate reductase family protein [Chloroflexota bacterium]